MARTPVSDTQCELTAIFKDPFKIYNYDDILKDISIQGRFKYLFSYLMGFPSTD